MIEPNQVEFAPQPVRPSGGSGRSLAVRMGIVAGSAVLFVIGAAAAMGASPAPAASTAPDPAASTAPDPAASAAPGTTKPAAPNGVKGPGPMGGMHGAFGMGGMRGGIGVGFRDITITGIDGSDLSLKTDDGWTRTIAVTADTKITKGGKTIGVGDLAVGDQIRFAETRNSDGTYTITEIHVVQPVIGGQVTAIDGSTITVTLPGGTTAKIHVSSDTAITVDGVTGAKLSDVKVNSFVIAEGTQRSDGSLDATTLHSGFGNRDGKGGPGHRGGPAAPDASPAPSTSAG